jgi:hypothetical protein
MLSSSDGLGSSSKGGRGSLSGGASVVELDSSKSEAALAHGAGILLQCADGAVAAGAHDGALPRAWSSSAGGCGVELRDDLL